MRYLQAIKPTICGGRFYQAGEYFSATERSARPLLEAKMVIDVGDRMSKYRVTLRKVLNVDKDVDPQIPIAKVLHRSWDIEATSKDHALQKLDAAFRDGLPNVRGFTLESIEELKAQEHSWPRKQ
jgi:hypothetical protein